MPMIPEKLPEDSVETAQHCPLIIIEASILTSLLYSPIIWCSSLEDTCSAKNALKSVLAAAAVLTRPSNCYMEHLFLGIPADFQKSSQYSLQTFTITIAR